MLQASLQRVLEKLRTEVQAFYGERLVSLVIFGSVGRGTPGFDSDIDFLVIVRDLPAGRMKRIREFDAVEERINPLIQSLRADGIHTSLSPVIKSPEEALQGSPLFFEMVEDAKILFDSGGFFAGVLAKLRNRLQALGSQRVRLGNAWYWILKPDIQRGEVFEI